MEQSLRFAAKADGRRFSRETFEQLFLDGWIVDGRDGGLVIGRRHAGGNIYIVQQVQDEFTFHRHLEGGEYIVNHRASERHMERLVELNRMGRGSDGELATLALSRATRVLNLHAAPFDKLLLVDYRGQFIVNRASTQRHLAELEQMNEESSDFRYCNPDAMIPV